MIGRKGNCLAISPDAFRQLEIKRHFPYEVLSKKILGYISLGVIWLIYEERDKLIKVPFARNRKWFDAIVSDVEFAVIGRLPQIYVV